MTASRVACALLAPILVASPACASGPRVDPAMITPGTFEPDVERTAPEVEWHRGPGVSREQTGPARYVASLYDAFDVQYALDIARYADRWYRAPANVGYEATLDRLAEELRAVGFGSSPNLELEIFESPLERPAWTPVRGSISLVVGGRAQELHAFERTEDVDRVMLPVNVGSFDVEGEVALHLADLEPGGILVTDAPARQVLKRAASRGAAAVVSASLYPFNRDPNGDRHIDAIQFTTLRTDVDLPVVQISPRSLRRVREAMETGRKVVVQAEAEVTLEERPLRTLVATVVGRERPDDAVLVVSHVQEPGACDNASGLSGLVASARGLVGALERGEIAWPRATVAFAWGDEFVQSEVWMEQSGRSPIAAISSDMTGESQELTGAIALLERGPDPGALAPLPPDEHTPWGAGTVEREDIFPNGLAVIGRCAMVDVGLLVGGWQSADHPWEGGSDHDVFIARGIPAVLFWHFTDFAYHTSLDRMEMVDGEEMRRTGVAILATALAVADARPTDLRRYLVSLDEERALRVSAAEEAGDPDAAQAWITWTTGARLWLRSLCLDLEASTSEQR
jgi:hypothetical protein